MSQRKEFRGTNPRAVEILNGLCKIIERYELNDQVLNAVLYLGREEMWALMTVAPEDLSIDRNYETGEVKLWGFPIVEVAKSNYAMIHTSEPLRGEGVMPK